MTNLIAIIAVSVVTNWTTVSTSYPVNTTIGAKPPVLSVRGSVKSSVGLSKETILLNQVGIVRKTTTATINWNGTNKVVVLESVDIGKEKRQIPRE